MQGHAPVGLRFLDHKLESELIEMKKYKELDNRERDILRACRNGWWLSGRYEATFDDHRKVFEADSIPMLFNDVSAWHGRHIENHADARVLVRCTLPC